MADDGKTVDVTEADLEGLATGALTPRRNDAMVKSALDELQKSGLAITPDNLVSAARHESHPLHAYFEWDDAKCGEKYRRMQAYKLIATQYTITRAVHGVTKEIRDGGDPVRAFLPLRDGRQEYVPRDVLMSDPKARQLNVDAFRAELRAWIRRTIDFPELGAERAAIEAVLDGK